jgi:hypothetical protein
MNMRNARRTLYAACLIGTRHYPWHAMRPRVNRRPAPPIPRDVERPLPDARRKQEGADGGRN